MFLISTICMIFETKTFAVKYSRHLVVGEEPYSLHLVEDRVVVGIDLVSSVNVPGQ